MILSRKSGKFFQWKQSGRQSIKAPKAIPAIWRRSMSHLSFLANLLCACRVGKKILVGIPCV